MATDTFTYTVSDGNGGTSTAAFTVTLTGENTPPVAFDDIYYVPENNTHAGDLFGYHGAGVDTDSDGDSLTLTAINGTAFTYNVPITLASGALVTLTSNDKFVYDPNGAFDGLAEGETSTDTFTYTISDGRGGTDTATASVQILGRNNDPALTLPSSPEFQPNSVDNFISGISVSDADTSELTVMLNAEGSLTLASTAGLTFTEGDGTADSAMTFSGSIEDINLALAGLTYTAATGDTDGDTLAIGVSDGETFVSAPGTFASTLQVSDIDGTNGFLIASEASSSFFGGVVSNLGDVNGDGVDDLIVTDYTANSSTGVAHVLFGSSLEPGAIFEISELDGYNGFSIHGVDAFDTSAVSASSADVNGDGVDDIIIGANGSDPQGITNAGETYIIFGQTGGQSADFDLSSLNGTNGFSVAGIDDSDNSGRSVSGIGDFNGDGVEDFLIGAYTADPGGAGNAGEAYIVFGTTNMMGSSFDLSGLNGSNGFVVTGATANDRLGAVVSAAGDVNGDGFDDVLLGALGVSVGGASEAGAGYVLFGSSSGFSSNLSVSTLNGTNGFAVTGNDANDTAGRYVSGAGDINGDGYDDVIIGADQADPHGKSSAGEAYVVFGASGGFSAEIAGSDLDGTNGFVLNGVASNDRFGWSVSSAGDVNNDGIDDLVASAYAADRPGYSNAGESYVVFGTTDGFNASLDLSDINGSNGFVIKIEEGGARLGWSISSAGDINDDGVDDLVIGAPNSGSNGAAYVIYGHSSVAESFSTYALNIGVSVSAYRDFGGDGTSDLMFQLDGGTTYSRLDDPTSSGAPSNEGRNGFSSIGLADIDGDDVLDNVIRAANNNYVIQFSGENTGASTVGGNAFDIVGFADLDGDGADEALATSTNPADERLYIADDGLTTLTRIGFNAQTSIGFGDFDGDGADEILIEQSSGGKRLFDDGLGVISVGKARLVAEAIGDFNGDGLDDVLTRHPNKNNHFFLVEGDETTPLNAATFIGFQSLELVAAGDFDGDGTLDILGNQNGTSFQMLTNGLTTLTAINFGNDTFEAVGDFNGDGSDDILLSRPNEQGRIVYSGDRNDTALIDALIGKSVRDVADYDGDGSDDLLVQDDVDGSYSILLSGVGSEIELDASLDGADVIDPNGLDTLGLLSITPAVAAGLEEGSPPSPAPATDNETQSRLFATMEQPTNSGTDEVLALHEPFTYWDEERDVAVISPADIGTFEWA